MHFIKWPRYFGLIIIIVSLINSDLYGQPKQLTKVLMPSPEVKAFQKYGDIPVSTYNGIPSISIPIYTIQSHDISVPISLSYHASGIKVNENSSRVGLGWVVNAGGMISRNVVGFDDFQGGHYLNAQTTRDSAPDLTNGFGPAFTLLDFWNHPPGYPVCQVPMFNKATGAVTLQNYNYQALIDKDVTGNLADFQPDQFYYNAGSLNGKFLLKRNREAIIQNADKIKINCLNDDATSWQLTGQDGMVYTFDKFEDSYNPSDGIGFKFKTAWQLTNITSPKGNQINFYYTQLSGQLQPSSSYSESKETFKTAPGYEAQSYKGTTKPERHTSLFGNIYALQVLDHIDYDNGRVVFNYSNDRQDLSEKRLISISIYGRDLQGNVNALPLKKVEFKQSYFVSTGATNTYATSTGGDPLKRLRLDSVIENGFHSGKIVPGSPYVFSYFQGGNNSLPPKNSFAVDHWGYYNGRIQNTSFIPSYQGMTGNTIGNYFTGVPGPEREPDTSFVRAFSLYKIKYPTGGSTEFHFEANDFDDAKSITNDNSQYTSQTALAQQTANFTYYADTHSVIGSDVLDMSKQYVGENGSIIPGKINCSFRLSGGQGPIYSLQQNLMYISVTNASGVEVLHIDPANYTQTPQTPAGPYYTYSANSSVISLIDVPLILPPGIYKWTAYSNTTNYAQYLMDMHSIFTWTIKINYDLSNSNSTSPTAYLAGGGLRVKRVIDRDAVNPLNDRVKKFVYHYIATGPDGQAHEYSYGKRMSKPQYTFWEPTYDVYHQQTDMGIVHDRSVWFYHLMRSSESDISLSGSGAGAVVAYDKVIVLNGENGEGGKSEYGYINEPDYIPSYKDSHFIQLKPPYNSNVPNALNGSLLSQTDYLNIGGVFQKIKQLTNYYTTNQMTENEVWGWERRDIQWNYYLDERIQAGRIERGPGPCEDIQLLAYRPLISKFNYLFSTEEKFYNEEDSTKVTTNVTYNFHDNTNHLLTTRTVNVNSKGEKITNNISYPLDYTLPNNTKQISQSIEALKSRNIIAAPIETFTSITNPDNTNSRVISAYLTSYNQYTAYPDTVFQLQSVTPVSSFVKLTDTTYIKNPAYTPLIVFDNYDSKGNLVQQHKFGGPNQSYMWAYNGNFPIAETIGSATSGTIAYTSFEEPGGYANITSNFLYTGAISVDPTSPTGRYCYNLSGGNVSALSTIYASTAYIVSYWTKNLTAYNIAGTTTGYPKQGKTVDEWTYFEHKITGQNSLIISGAGLIDELRLYPDGSQMSTYAFDPLAGMTESVDVKNKVTHFEYDGMARLLNIKDEDKNILKNYRYNYQSLIVPNLQLLGTFTRNDCPPFTTPSAPVTIIIPPGKYYGHDQAAAQAAAQADLDYNGQAYANATCSCNTTTVTVTLSNSTGVSGFQAYFSGLTSYAFPANGTTTISIPAGNYNITINPINAPTNRKFTLSGSTGGSTVVTAPGTTFNGKTVDTGINNIISIQAP